MLCRSPGSVEHVKNHPYLGLELDSTLSWNPHMKNTLTKSQRTLNLLRRNLHDCSPKTKETAYKTLVRPTLEYASSAWDPYVGKQVKKLEAVQNKAARFVTSQHHWETSVTKLKDTLGWRSLQERRFIARMTLWYKAIHAQAAVSIPSYYAPKPVDPNDTGIRASHDQPTVLLPHRHNRPMESIHYSSGTSEFGTFSHPIL